MRLNKSGFTLLEVMVVVLIAVMITVASVPVYKKNQERNRYLAASGVLIDLGNAMRMYNDDYTQRKIDSPSIDVDDCSGQILDVNHNVGANVTTVNVNEECTNLVDWLQLNGYLGKIPFENGKYKGYQFKIATAESGMETRVTCTDTCKDTSEHPGVACMWNADSTIVDYQCAWVDKWGMIYHKALD